MQEISTIIDVFGFTYDRPSRDIKSYGLLIVMGKNRNEIEWDAKYHDSKWSIDIKELPEEYEDLLSQIKQAIKAAIGAVKVPYRHHGRVRRM